MNATEVECRDLASLESVLITDFTVNLPPPPRTSSGARRSTMYYFQLWILTLKNVLRHLATDFDLLPKYPSIGVDPSACPRDQRRATNDSEYRMVWTMYSFEEQVCCWWCETRIVSTKNLVFCSSRMLPPAYACSQSRKQNIKFQQSSPFRPNIAFRTSSCASEQRGQERWSRAPV